MPSIMGILNVVAQYPDAAAGLEREVDRVRTGMPGTRTELPAPAVGETSRAIAVTTPAIGGFSASTTFIAIRRGDVVASVLVTSLGDTPPSDVALRLAQSVDRRLTAALSPGAQPGT
jgi:hypothetical protein